MKHITYNDYTKYINSKKLRLEEQNVEYKNSNQTKEEIYDEQKLKEIDKMHDKMFRNILSIKNEMIKFLSQFLYIKETEIIQCNSDFITKTYKEKHSDTIYKLKEKPVYFLVEHQSTVDKEMPERIIEYIGEIMRKGRRNNKYPIVVPIVIYTGIQKWNAATNIAQKQYDVLNYEKNKINLEYNLIDIHNYTFQGLLVKKSLFASIMIMEKCITKKDLEIQMNKIIDVIKEPKDKEVLSEIVKNIVAPKIGKNIAKQMLEKINNKEEIGMSPLTKMLLDWEIEREEQKIAGRAEGRAEGREEGKHEGKLETIVETAKKMIKRNMNFKDIQEITGLSKKEIEKLKLEIAK